MKRMFAILLALLTLLTLSTPALADVMWEPMDNSFFTRHRSQCDYENRAYYANGKDGFVTMWDAPDGSIVRGQYENGAKLWVYHIYDNKWALIACWEDHKETSGWVSMKDLVLVYDYICFEEEYADKITEYNGEFAEYDGDVEEVNFYEYPGAAEISRSYQTSGQGDVLGNLTGTADSRSYISSIFVDEEGRTWGYVNYMYGHLNSWFCLDEPDGGNFPVRAVSDPGLIPAQTPRLPAAGYTPYILVAVVVAVTAGLLAFFYGKKRNKTAE
ncbi:MAG: hypothetical protein K2N78_11840 [Oscillospiraceae bacterium]|nr:hypothetical protein [Oscillospiraceae bacterium]